MNKQAKSLHDLFKVIEGFSQVWMEDSWKGDIWNTTLRLLGNTFQ